MSLSGLTLPALVMLVKFKFGRIYDYLLMGLLLLIVTMLAVMSIRKGMSTVSTVMSSRKVVIIVTNIMRRS